MFQLPKCLRKKLGQTHLQSHLSQRELTQKPSYIKSSAMMLRYSLLASLFAASSVSGQCPATPPGGCSVCGEGLCVGNSEAIFVFPGQPEVACGLLEEAGYTGAVPLDQCGFLSALIGVCECGTVPTSGGGPTAPVVTPTAPVVAPVVTPTAPVVTPTAPVVTPTAPVVTPTAPVVTPTAPVVTPTAPVVTPTAPVVSPTAPVVTPTAPVVAPTPKEDTPAPVEPTASTPSCEFI
jgi:hypothetical protein